MVEPCVFLFKRCEWLSKWTGINAFKEIWTPNDPFIIMFSTKKLRLSTLSCFA